MHGRMAVRIMQAFMNPHIGYVSVYTHINKYKNMFTVNLFPRDAKL